MNNDIKKELEKAIDNRKELSVHMQFYMKCDNCKNQDELEEEFKSLIDKFIDEHGLDYQIYDMEIQED